MGVKSQHVEMCLDRAKKDLARCKRLLRWDGFALLSIAVVLVLIQEAEGLSLAILLGLGGISTVWLTYSTAITVMLARRNVADFIVLSEQDIKEEPDGSN